MTTNSFVKTDRFHDAFSTVYDKGRYHTRPCTRDQRGIIVSYDTIIPGVISLSFSYCPPSFVSVKRVVQ